MKRAAEQRISWGRPSLRRRLAATVLMATAAVAALIWIAISAGHLPDPVATHFSGVTANGFTGRSTFLVIVTVLAAISLLAAIGTHVLSPLVAAIVGVAGLLCGVVALMMVAIADTTEGVRANPVVLAVSFLAIVAAIGVMWLLAPIASAPQRSPAAPHPEHGEPALAPGQAMAWHAVARTPVWLLVLLLAVAFLPVLLSLITARRVGTDSIAISVVLLLVAVMATPIRVSADRRGLRVAAGVLQIPLRRIAVDQITEAWSETINPMQWGGWGYRWLPGRQALILHGGPGVVVRTTGGSLFAVTVDDPDGAVRALRTNGAGGVK